MDQNRLITIEELIVGDEVIIPHMGDFKYLKIVRTPQMSKKGWSWRPNVTRWKPVKCALHLDSITQKYGSTLQYTRVIRKYYCDGNFNQERFVDFNFKSIWLVKREEKI